MLKSLIPSVLRKWIHSLRYRPRHVQMGDGSYILRPFTIINPDRVKIGRNTKLLPASTIQPIRTYAGVQHNPFIVIGDGVYIGRHAFLAAIDRVQIENGSVLSDYVYMCDASHGFDPSGPPIMDQPLNSKGPIHIGPNCFLGYRSIIMPGVSLGERCIVGANSVVTKSFASYSIIGGAPARLIRMYTPETTSLTKSIHEAP